MTGNILDSQSHLFRWLFTFHSASRDSILQRSVHGQAAFWARGRVPEVHIRAHLMMFTWFMIVMLRVWLCCVIGEGYNLRVLFLIDIPEYFPKDISSYPEIQSFENLK